MAKRYAQIAAAPGGGAMTVADEGGALPAVTGFNFIGDNVVVAESGGIAEVTVSGGGGGAIGGTTAQRPVTPAQYTAYFDTTLGLPITYFGVVWVDAAGGGSVMAELPVDVLTFNERGGDPGATASSGKYYTKDVGTF